MCACVFVPSYIVVLVHSTIYSYSYLILHCLEDSPVCELVAILHTNLGSGIEIIPG